MSNYWLRPVPTTDWAGLTAKYAGLRWYWSDLTGAHNQAGLPSEIPTATHAWGWASHQWVRLRIDGSAACGAELIETSNDDIADGFVPATVVARESQTWPSGDNRVGLVTAGSDSLREQPVTLREVSTPVSMSFMGWGS